jgi:hypothetical protein
MAIVKVEAMAAQLEREIVGLSEADKRLCRILLAAIHVITIPLHAAIWGPLPRAFRKEIERFAARSARISKRKPQIVAALVEYYRSQGHKKSRQPKKQPTAYDMVANVLGLSPSRVANLDAEGRRLKLLPKKHGKSVTKTPSI